MPRRAHLCSIVCALFLAAVAALAQDAPPAEVAQLSVKDLSGQPQSLESHRGQIVVLNFWATWCVPCREEMPLLVKLQKDYAARGVTVIGPSTDDESTQKNIVPFLRKLKITFPAWIGATTEDRQRFGLGTALPATAVLDREGRIVGRIVGPLEEADLRARLDWLLGDRSTSVPNPLFDSFAKKIAEHDAAHPDHQHKDGEDHAHPAGLNGASTVPS